MKKFLITIQEIFKTDTNFEHKQALNSLMTLILKDKKTADSIKLFEDLRYKFEQEIAKRGIDVLIEHTTCEEYFDKTRKTTNQNIKL